LKSARGNDIATIKNDYLLRGMEGLNYDAMNLSHREFYSGSEFLQDAQKKYNLHFISANIRYKESQKLFTEPYIVKSIRSGFSLNSTKIGIMGLTEERSRLLPTRFKELPQIEAVDPVPVTMELIPELSKKSDLIILLYSGRMKTLEKILEQTDKIDVVIVAQEYYRVDNFTNDRPIVVSSSSQGKYFSTLELEFNDKGIQSSKKMKKPLTKSIPDDPKMAELVEEYLTIEKQELQKQAN